MSNYSTRTGDDGTTSLLGAGRVSKASARPEVYGALDEASAAIGVARAAAADPNGRVVLLAVQRDLYNMMSEVAATAENAARFRKLNSERMDWLESQLKKIGDQVPVPNEFVLFGESSAAAACDLARTIVRRAERRLVGLADAGQFDNPLLVQYLNRLSSLLFVMALHEHQLAGAGSPSAARPDR